MGKYFIYLNVIKQVKKKKKEKGENSKKEQFVG